LSSSPPWARRLAVAVAAAMGAVSLATLSLDPQVTARWGVSMSHIDFSQFARVAPLPLLAIAGCALCFRWARAEQFELRPYLAALAIFAGGFGGLALSVFPNVAPYGVTIWQAAAEDNALSFMLVGVALMLPVILGYTAYVYWIFRGKASAEDAYH
jgi:cytochrome d ubiquinol oxidase subunit II